MLFGGCVQTSTLISTSNGKEKWGALVSAHLCLRENNICMYVHTCKMRGWLQQQRDWSWEWGGIILAFIGKKTDCQIITVKPQKHVWRLRPGCWNHRPPSFLLQIACWDQNTQWITHDKIKCIYNMVYIFMALSSLSVFNNFFTRPCRHAGMVMPSGDYLGSTGDWMVLGQVLM